ncbi:PREDICTED: sodium-coupled neutral amino acid transporter 5 isoform X2 [Galeopterus variegatus]|uniref:Sodium-coupled neutral amino acid transporter 5 isoform X2 n=1 Tax=Galeopterus variegatus TaxID=482537 RepID=A0ABM0QMV3_GALVR|nr:PREDICTED: sodium-coupled neutral amino acid transporter 5 isoform X2 [Galeopterus variegatus]
MELQDPKMNGALPADAVGYRQEREGFLPSRGPAPGRKPVQFMDFEGKTSFGMSVFNLSNAIMGSGILGLAYAMAHTGVLFFLALLLCIALLSSYSIHLLLTCAGVVGIRAYEQLGQRAFGPAGKVVVATVICLHNVGAMSSYLFIIKSELPLVIGTFLGMDPEGYWFLKGNFLIIIVSVIIILPLALMKHLGYLGYTSGLSLTCMLFFLISVIYKKFQLGCVVGRNETAVESEAPPGLLIQGLNSSCEAQMFTVDSQAIPKKDAGCGQRVHWGHVLHVWAHSNLWIPHLLQQRGGGDAAHVQPQGRAHPLRTPGRAACSDPYCASRAISYPPGPAAAAFPKQGLQLATACDHSPDPAYFGQCSCHLCADHPGYLWGYRVHLSPQSHLHPSQHLLPPHHTL